MNWWVKLVGAKLATFQICSLPIWSTTMKACEMRMIRCQRQYQKRDGDSGAQHWNMRCQSQGANIKISVFWLSNCCVQNGKVQTSEDVVEMKRDEQDNRVCPILSFNFYSEIISFKSWTHCMQTLLVVITSMFRTKVTEFIIAWITR